VEREREREMKVVLLPSPIAVMSL
jgi:hypothetical protein